MRSTQRRSALPLPLLLQLLLLLPSVLPIRRTASDTNDQTQRLVSIQRVTFSNCKACCYSLLLIAVLGLSSSQYRGLRDELHAAGIGVRGKSRSEVDLFTMVHAVDVLQRQHSFSPNQAFNAVAAQHLATPATVRSAYSSYSSCGTVTPVSSYDKRGRTDQVAGLSFEAELTVHRHLTAVKHDNTYESATTLRNALAAENGVQTSKSSVLRWLSCNGYQYGRKRYMGMMHPSLKNQFMRAFICRYALSLRDQREGKAVIVYTDESYIHTGSSTDYLWFSPQSDDKSDVRAVERGGYRLILMHAMTSEGMLSALSDNAQPSNDLTDTQLTAEFAFRSAGINDDYHATIDGSRWVAWLNNRLIPTFQARYPGKKMVLVLDGAKYHKARPHDWVSPSQMSKVAAVSYLQHHGVRSISVTRHGAEQTVTEANFEGRGRKCATLAELKSAVAAHLSAHAEINVTLPQRAFNRYGYQLLYTPPYTPEVQPIEMVWAAVKHLVRTQAVSGRTEEQCRQQTEAAFEQQSADSCVARIAHCHKYISEWLRHDGAGQLQQYSDLDDIVSSLPAHTHGILHETEAMDVDDGMDVE